MSIRCLRISGSSSCAEAGRQIGAMTSGLTDFTFETSVERSDGGSGQAMTSSSRSVQAGLAALYAARKPRHWFWPKRSLQYIGATRLGVTLASAKISVKYCTAL